MELEPSSANRRLIAGIGSALVDILIEESDEFIEATGAAKGGMTLVPHHTLMSLLDQTTAHLTVVPGGSACNTLIGCGQLGAPARFIGKRGDDAMGRLFEDGLRRNNVEPKLLTSSTATGQVLSVITPDAQRTMFTCLGASAEAVPAEVTAEDFRDAAIVHIEGYLLFNRDLMEAALRAAKAAGAKVSLDMASFTVVAAAKLYLKEFIRDYVDIVIANEEEARVYTGCGDERDALTTLAEQAEIAALKVGARGSYIAQGGEVIQVPPVGSGSAIDTTGAGDLWAAGLLYGLVNGYTLEKCGALASACGYEVCQVVGAQIPDEGWQRIHKLLTT